MFFRTVWARIYYCRMQCAPMYHVLGSFVKSGKVSANKVMNGSLKYEFQIKQFQDVLAPGESFGLWQRLYDDIEETEELFRTFFVFISDPAEAEAEAA